MMKTPLQNFSRDYVIAPSVEVNTYDGPLALIDSDVYADIVSVVGKPLIGYTGGLHYQFKPSQNVLADRAAVPTNNHHPEEHLELLISK